MVLHIELYRRYRITERLCDISETAMALLVTVRHDSFSCSRLISLTINPSLILNQTDSNSESCYCDSHSYSETDLRSALDPTVILITSKLFSEIICTSVCTRKITNYNSVHIRKKNQKVIYKTDTKK